MQLSQRNILLHQKEVWDSCHTILMFIIFQILYEKIALHLYFKGKVVQYESTKRLSNEFTSKYLQI